MHLTRLRGDVREFPRYSISEAAFYIRMPASTLRAWTRGQDYITHGVHRTFDPVIDPADPQNKLLSFYNLVEAHVLRSTIESGVPLRSMRKALKYIRGTIPGKHPLLTHDFEVSGKDAFIQHLGMTICATRDGQLAMRKIIEQHLRRIVRDDNGLPLKVFPINSKRLAIDPLFASGKPIVKNRGITASVLWARNKTGESIPEIAKDYGLRTIEVKEAIADYEWKVAA
ncbi:MAG: DUF433 domain-containing protein [Candidatus Acidiferrales bacterium]